MDVIIVSKTQMTSGVCVGGILANGRFVRLLNTDGYNQNSDTKLAVGDVYTITFSKRIEIIPPHIEDILVHTISYKFSFSTIDEMVEYLVDKLKIKIWRGSTEMLFDGTLLWTNGGSGYVSENGQIPGSSVGFWVSDKDLIRKDYNDKVRYSYPIKWRNISFVGFQEPVNIIPAGTLLRVSLARWWSPNEEEERCYLQLSGWYTLTKEDEDEDEVDLPF